MAKRTDAVTVTKDELDVAFMLFSVVSKRRSRAAKIFVLEII